MDSLSDYYIRVEWPEIQEFIEHPDYEKEVYCGNIIGNPDSHCWFVPYDLYMKVIDKEIITEFEGIQFSSNQDLYRGALVLFTNNDKVWIGKCTSPGGAGLPALFDIDEIPGINCEIIGVQIK